MSTPALPEMDELIQRMLDGQIEPDQMDRLQEAILNDPSAMDYYIDSLVVCAVLRRSSQATGELSKSDLLRSLSAVTRPRGIGHMARPLGYLAAVLVLGALLLAGIGIWLAKATGPAIGSLEVQYEARWGGLQPRPGGPLRTGQYDLSEGLAQMHLDTGVRLLLEAPCQVDLASARQVRLRRGILRVTVSEPARGFQVNTPTAQITDLGTEFGVITRSDGSTEVHVLKGRILIAPDPSNAGRQRPVVLDEGRAATIDARGSTIKAGLAAQPEMFVRELPPSNRPSGPPTGLNLADMVGGGNGRGTGTLERGIDLGTGLPFDGPARAIKRATSATFCPLPQVRWIDGVFVPNAAGGPVVISSTGLVFAECPPTQGTYYGGPTNSGRFFDIPTRRLHAVLLGGIRYGTPHHPSLALHPNAGITLDLDRIRQDNPDIRIDRFTAVCGIPRNLPQTQFSDADVWILLDGAIGLHLHYPRGQYLVHRVDIPIPGRVRFLTLAATCSGRADYSWILFGDPFLGPAVGASGADSLVRTVSGGTGAPDDLEPVT